MARTFRLCGPYDVTAARAGIARTTRDNHGDGRYTQHFACGCQFHGRICQDGPLRGHHYGDGSETLCASHAIPDGDDE